MGLFACKHAMMTNRDTLKSQPPNPDPRRPLRHHRRQYAPGALPATNKSRPNIEKP